MTPAPANPPSVAVVIPLYNKGPYIARALKSVQAQTFAAFEVIVVDDGSTDGGPAIVEKYGDPRIRLIRQANAGPGAARNRGIRETSAPLVAFLDADDEWMPHHLHRLVKRLAAHPQCAVAVGGMIVSSGKEDRGSWYRRPEFSEGPWRLRPDMSVEVLYRVLNQIGPAIVCRRTALEQTTGFYENRCMLREDTYLWVQLLLNYEFYWDPEPSAYYHVTASELTGLRNRPHPPCPVTVDPAPIRERCPSEYQPFLERFLAFYAMRDAVGMARTGDYTTGLRVVRQYPLARTMRAAYLNVHLQVLLMIAVAPLARWVRASPTRRQWVRWLRDLVWGRR
jgi:cellulose synthase/poly-beta-1,6-N-acetylglucosamine synthase-like glycosyltransferase